MGFSHRQIASLLGDTDPSMVSHYEHGRALPSLEAALGLEIILRTPVAFLFPVLYEKLKASIRQREDEDMVASNRNPS
jgi:transcriptional regulator with XRE-family HTH domain